MAHLSYVTPEIIHGNGANCVLVCVYGNRAYGDTLVEMEDAAKECGFQVTAAISAVADPIRTETMIRD